MRHALRPHGWEGLDCPISKEGEVQSSQIHWACDLAIVSNLVRTQQTLQHSNIQAKKIIVTELCREYMGGSRPDYVDKDDPKLKVETRKEFDERLAKFKEMIKELSKTHQSILVVTHGIFMAHLLKLQRGIHNCEFQPFFE